MRSVFYIQVYIINFKDCMIHETFISYIIIIISMNLQ